MGHTQRLHDRKEEGPQYDLYRICVRGTTNFQFITCCCGKRWCMFRYETPADLRFRDTEHPYHLPVSTQEVFRKWDEFVYVDGEYVNPGLHRAYGRLDTPIDPVLYGNPLHHSPSDSSMPESIQAFVKCIHDKLQTWVPPLFRRYRVFRGSAIVSGFLAFDVDFSTVIELDAYAGTHQDAHLVDFVSPNKMEQILTALGFADAMIHSTGKPAIAVVDERLHLHWRQLATDYTAMEVTSPMKHAPVIIYILIVFLAHRTFVSRALKRTPSRSYIHTHKHIHTAGIPPPSLVGRSQGPKNLCKRNCRR